MKLIYYCSRNSNAPAKISSELYKHIVKKSDLNFSLVPYPTPVSRSCDIPEITNLTSDEVFAIHITTSPFVAPTKRFLLHMRSIVRKIPIILNYHGDIRVETKNQLKNKSAYDFLKYIPSYLCVPFFLNNAHTVIVNSHSMKKMIIDKYKINSDVVVIPNAISDFWYHKKDSKMELDGTPSILYHGRLSHEKGVDILIKGFAKSKQSSAMLYIIGTGAQEKYLKDLVKKENVENNVRFLGHIPHDTLRSYFQSVDLAIYPSRYESFSLAILEALSTVNGTVFFSKEAGIYDFVKNMEFKLKSFSPSVENVSQIIKDYEYVDKDWTLVASQKEFSEKFRWDSIIEEYIKLYNSIFKKR